MLRVIDKFKESFATDENQINDSRAKIYQLKQENDFEQTKLQPLFQFVHGSVEQIKQEDISQVIEILEPSKEANAVAMAVCLLMNKQPILKKNKNTELTIDYWNPF